MKMEEWQGFMIYLNFQKKHNIKLASIEDLISYRLKYEKLISRSTHKIIKLNKNSTETFIITKNKLENNVNFAISKGKSREKNQYQ